MDKFLNKRPLDDEERRESEAEKNTKKLKAMKDTLTICSHNCNSLYTRLTKENNVKKQYDSLIKENDIDIFFFQEVRAPADKNDRSKILYDSKKKDEKDILQNFLKDDFDKFYSLADKRYSGSLLAIRKGLKYEWIAYNFQAAFDLDHNLDVKFNADKIDKNHDIEGRIIIIHFLTFTVLGTYSPNNGYNENGHSKREQFDREVKLFLVHWKHPIIWIGDLNIAPTKNDTSHPDVFENENHREGMPGVTKTERSRFQAIIQEADLIDAWKLMNGHENKNEDELYNIDGPNFTWRGGIGKYHLMGMRLDHVFVSSKFREKIVDAKILGHSVNMTGFLGSDHCPIKVIVQKN